MRRVLVWIIALAIIGGGGYGIFQFWGSQPVKEEQVTRAPAVADVEIQTAASEPVREAIEAPEDRFVFKRLNISTAEELPEACLVFSDSLDASGSTRYEDYLRFDPEIEPGLVVRGEQLCIQGLQFASKYRVDVRKGMPSADGELLAFDEDIPLELQDRPSMVQFGAGLILPKESADGVPVTTVNVELLDIKVLRVGDRLLSQLRTGLIDERSLYSYDTYEIENEKGEVVWEGEMVVDSAKNESVQTIFNVRDAVVDWRPGVYLILATDSAEKEQIQRQSYYYGATAAQWIIDSDIGLTTFRGDDGLHVFTRSFQTAEPIRGVELALIARNNEELARVRTGEDGSAHFTAPLLRGAGGSEPVAVMAYGRDQDFNYLDLRRPSFDLTDRGVSGRAIPGSVDAYLYTDRGIYRPGERVHLITMLRDPDVIALDDLPLSISLLRPDGIEYRKWTSTDQESGIDYLEIPLSDSAPRGRWQAVAYVDSSGSPVGRASFDVQDFVPQRLAVDLNTQAVIWEPATELAVDVMSRFLYGAPASQLGGEAELKIMVDPNPYPDYPGYRFGRIKEMYRDSFTELDLPETDDEGKTIVLGEVPILEQTTLPLRARLRVSVYEPGGRVTQNEIYRPVRTSEAMIGIRPNFDGDRVRENTPADFEIVMLNKFGDRRGSSGLSYRVIREETHYQWYQVNERWQYEVIVRERELDAGTLDIGLEEPARVSQVLPWGQYRLLVTDSDNQIASSVRFYVGWGGSSPQGRPDRVAVSLDKETYSPGDVAMLDVRPPVAGKALLVVASDRIHETRLLNLSEDGGQVEIPVSQDWGTGVYVLVNVYKPLGPNSPQGPVRSIGLSWLGIDQSERTLSVDFEAPERVIPRQKISIPIKVSGLASGEPAYVTLVAVDVGILQLTKFQSPSPQDFYFGKRRLAVDIRDDYGRLITDADGAMGEIRAGGDAIGGAGLSVVPTKTVALFSDIVTLDRNGEAEIELTSPDLVGELRLMAVAMSSERVGSGERPLTVRDDVVADMTLPRFLAPGDNSQATVLLHNVDGPPGDYNLRVSVIEAVSTEGSNEFVQNVSLAEDERTLLKLPVDGVEPGIGTISLILEGPNDFRINRNWPIEVRPAQLPVSNEIVELMAPGATVELTAAQVEHFYDDTASLAMSISSTRGTDVPGLLRWLDRYPYGCLEQTVSRAFPLLYYNDLALLSSLETDEALSLRIQRAADRVVDLQTPNGGFGMWGPWDYEANAWLSVFAIDFLTQAKAQDHVVATDAIDRGLNWLRQMAGQSYRERWARSYAYYVLAREGAMNAGDLRYFADTELNSIENPLSAAHLAAALVEIGDRARARLAFDRALALSVGEESAVYEPTPYGSRLRDLSGVIAVAASVDETRVLPAVFDVVDDLDNRLEYTTTQEKAWMLFAAHELSDSAGRLDLDISGYDVSGNSDPVFITPSINELAGGVSVSNSGDRDIWRTVTLAGVPKEPLGQQSSGVTLRKSYLSLDGSPVNLSSVKQNDRLVVLLNGQMNDDTYREMIALDLLPAGWEIEGLLKPEDTGYLWLPPLTATTMSEARDDRFVAAFNIGSRFRESPEDKERRQPRFTLAYLVRATTPGTFVLPAARVEDMYGPRIFARTDEGRLVVTEAQ